MQIATYPSTTWPTPATSQIPGTMWSYSLGFGFIIKTILIMTTTTDTMAMVLQGPWAFSALQEATLRKESWQVPMLAPTISPPLPHEDLESFPGPHKLANTLSSLGSGDLPYNQGRLNPPWGFL